MRITTKVKVYELVHDTGQVSYKIFSALEARKLRSKKKSKTLITAKLVGNLSITLQIKNLAL